MKERKVWETIADSWAHLRTKPEKEILDFSKNVKTDPILDVGCGNGRNLLPFLQKGLKCFGLDFSRSMIREAKKFLKKRNLNASFVVGDAVKLPFKSKSFTTVILVRVLPHIETKKKRLECLKEMKRVGKEVIISCWYKWDRKLFWVVLKHFFSSDVYVDWNYHGKIYKRFHHLYTKRELKKDLREVNLNIKKFWYDKRGNIWAIVE